MADGSSAATPIVFTSYKDDAQGGDTNGDSTATMPGSNNWRGLRLGASGSSFERCRFSYGGGSSDPVLDVGSNSATIKGSVFAHNRGPDDSVAAYPALDALQAKSEAMRPRRAGTSSKVRPPRRRPALFFGRRSHCSKKKGTLAPRHASSKLPPAQVPSNERPARSLRPR